LSFPFSRLTLEVVTMGVRHLERNNQGARNMQAKLEVSTTSAPALSESEAQHIANAYVANCIDPSLEAVSGALYQSKPLGRLVWRFIIRSALGPVGIIQVDVRTGNVIPLTGDEIRVLREKAAIFVAKNHGRLPVDEHGFVLVEYARRQADSYLGMEVSLFYSATNGVYIPLERPIWQFAIQVRLPRLGVLGILGTLDVDARTGDVIPLTHKQIKKIRERADAIVQFRTQTATA
jgi:hypothetical protein